MKQRQNRLTDAGSRQQTRCASARCRRLSSAHWPHYQRRCVGRWPVGCVCDDDKPVDGLQFVDVGIVCGSFPSDDFVTLEEIFEDCSGFFLGVGAILDRAADAFAAVVQSSFIVDFAVVGVIDVAFGAFATIGVYNELVEVAQHVSSPALFGRAYSFGELFEHGSSHRVGSWFVAPVVYC